MANSIPTKQTDRSTCRNHLCFHGDSCIDLWDVLLWVPAAVSWWGKALEWLSLSRIPCFLHFRLCTQSPQTLLNGTCLYNQSIWHQSVDLVSTWKGKVIPHSMHFLPHEHTPPDPDAQSPEWNRIKRVRKRDGRAPEFTRDYSLIKRHTIRETAMERIALHMIWAAKGETRVQIHQREKWLPPLISFSLSEDEQLEPFSSACFASCIGIIAWL